MNKLKISLIALAVLGLSASAQAYGGHRGHNNHGRDHDRARGYQRWQAPARHVVLEKRVVYQAPQRHAPRCEAPRQVVYVPARMLFKPSRVVIQPGVQVQIALGF